MLIRTAQLTNKEVSSRIGCSPSYLSRILSGERVPTWELTRKFAHACGADPESCVPCESRRSSARKFANRPPTPTPLPCPPPIGYGPRFIHCTCAQDAPRPVTSPSPAGGCSPPGPSPPSSKASSCHPPTCCATSYASWAATSTTPPNSWTTPTAKPPAAQHSCSQPQTPDPIPRRPHPRTPHSTSACPPLRHNRLTGPDAVMKTFSKVLTEDRTVEDGRARLLHKQARRATPTDRARRRPVTSIAEVLRQRKLPPAPSEEHDRAQPELSLSFI
ncbi:helix-turn-helix transcriptional regulator [Streptomyces sp. NPDC006235]|uniref:helix-turn-helix domain-containing protein n=1 Tax=Streptomyces sp. NPDC006235 TaxID=3156736 RepID=UPI0033B9EC14